MAGSEDSLVLVERLSPAVATITLNRPSALNALTRGMMVRLAHIISSLSQDAELRVIILTGAGRAFCAGVDLTAAQSVFKGDVKNADEDPVVQMELCPIPIIGAINGHAITAGFEIALACDILIASPNAKFADTHAKFGIFPSWGLSQKLPRLIGVNRAREVSLTAAPIDGATAERWGLVSRLVPQNELLKAAQDIAEAICNNQQGLVRRYKAVINDGLSLPLGEGRKLERVSGMMKDFESDNSDNDLGGHRGWDEMERAHEYYSTMKPEDFKAMQKFIAGRSKAGSSQGHARL